MSDTLVVTVVWALPDVQWQAELTLPAGATLHEAVQTARPLIQADGVAEPPSDVAVGVWGRVMPETTPLAHGDRVELYRPLHLDPKAIRRLRAEKAALKAARSRST